MFTAPINHSLQTNQVQGSPILRSFSDPSPWRFACPPQQRLPVPVLAMFCLVFLTRCCHKTCLSDRSCRPGHCQVATGAVPSLVRGSKRTASLGRKQTLCEEFYSIHGKINLLETVQLPCPDVCVHTRFLHPVPDQAPSRNCSHRASALTCCRGARQERFHAGTQYCRLIQLDRKLDLRPTGVGRAQAPELQTRRPQVDQAPGT